MRYFVCKKCYYHKKQKDLEENNKSKVTGQEIFLDAYVREYEFAFETKARVESKAGMFIVLISAVIAYLFSVFRLPINDGTSIYTVKIVLITLIGLAILSNLIYVLLVLTPKPYSRIDLMELAEEDYDLPEKDTYEVLIKHYKESTAINIAYNEMKSKHFLISLYTFVISIILIMILQILS